MKLCYQVSTPEVRPAPGVTAYQSDLETSFRRLKECGYEGAELMVANPALIDVKEVERLAKKYELDIPMVCSGEILGQDGLTFSDPDDARREEAISRVKAAIDVAAYFGAMINIGRVRGGYVWGYDNDWCRARSVDGLRQVALYAQEKGVTVCLEPVNTIAANFINTTQEGIAMVHEINVPSFSLMLDSNHMFICDLDMIKSVHDAKGYVKYVHLVDSNRLYPGSCKLDFGAFFKALREIGYDGYVSVEVFQRPDQDTALEKSAEFIKQFL